MGTRRVGYHALSGESGPGISIALVLALERDGTNEPASRNSIKKTRIEQFSGRAIQGARKRQGRQEKWQRGV
jgi:hypothetical protein